MVNLAPPPRDWTEAIAASAKPFMNARVCFYKDDGTGNFDPLTNSGDPSGIELLWVGLARVQHLRSAQTVAADYEASANRSFRFQVDKDAGLPFLPSGTKGRVLNAGVSGPGTMIPGDPQLEQLTYVVDSSINASHFAVKTIELRATMRPVEWTWDVNDAGEVI